MTYCRDYAKTDRSWPKSASRLSHLNAGNPAGWKSDERDERVVMFTMVSCAMEFIKEHPGWVIYALILIPGVLRKNGLRILIGADRQAVKRNVDDLACITRSGKFVKADELVKI